MQMFALKRQQLSSQMLYEKRRRANVEGTFPKLPLCCNSIAPLCSKGSQGNRYLTESKPLTEVLADYCFYFHLNFEIDLPVASLQNFSRELPGMSANHKVYFFPQLQICAGVFSSLFFRPFFSGRSRMRFEVPFRSLSLFIPCNALQFLAPPTPLSAVRYAFASAAAAAAGSVALCMTFNQVDDCI